jgi:hypothetical protein
MWPEQLHELAEAADGPFAQQAAQLARSTGTAIVYGYPERDGDSVFNSALAIGADGTPLPTIASWPFRRAARKAGLHRARASRCSSLAA